MRPWSLDMAMEHSHGPRYGPSLREVAMATAIAANGKAKPPCTCPNKAIEDLCHISLVVKLWDKKQ